MKSSGDKTLNNTTLSRSLTIASAHLGFPHMKVRFPAVESSNIAPSPIRGAWAASNVSTPQSKGANDHKPLEKSLRRGKAARLPPNISRERRRSALRGLSVPEPHSPPAGPKRPSPPPNAVYLRPSATSPTGDDKIRRRRRVTLPEATFLFRKNRRVSRR